MSRSLPTTLAAEAHRAEGQWLITTTTTTTTTTTDYSNKVTTENIGVGT
jgi:hypothetical protein